jgi:hypothetical protein
VKDKFKAIDLAMTQGSGAGVTAISTYAVEGDTLKYINSPEPRATEFVTKPGDGRAYGVFRRTSSEPEFHKQTKRQVEALTVKKAPLPARQPPAHGLSAGEALHPV